MWERLARPAREILKHDLAERFGVWADSLKGPSSAVVATRAEFKRRPADATIARVLSALRVEELVAFVVYNEPWVRDRHAAKKPTPPADAATPPKTDGASTGSAGTGAAGGSSGGKPAGKPRRLRQQCHGCGKYGHVVAECWGTTGKPAAAAAATKTTSTTTAAPAAAKSSGAGAQARAVLRAKMLAAMGVEGAAAAESTAAPGRGTPAVDEPSDEDVTAALDELLAGVFSSD